MTVVNLSKYWCGSVKIIERDSNVMRIVRITKKDRMMIAESDAHSIQNIGFFFHIEQE